MEFNSGGTMKDFESFLESGHAQLEASSLDHLKKELFPSFWQVALKLGLIHLLSSLLSLMACPQFGLRIFFNGHGLMKYFMHAGDVGCFAFCGAFYLGTTLWLAKIFLGEFEWALIRRNSFLGLGSLTLISLGALLMFTGEEIRFEVALIWILGALVGGAIPLRTPVRHRPLLRF